MFETRLDASTFPPACDGGAHDIPHPIGDPDDDDGGLVEDDEQDEDDEDDDDEEPMQVRHGFIEVQIFALQHELGFSAIIKSLRRSASFHLRLPAASSLH